MPTDLRLTLLVLLSAALESSSVSPPGKPVLLGCRSPEKETFTCWWQPGSDGGLPTTHRLYYETERLEGAYECPDYRSAGRNSCFFDKNHTSIWVDYYLTVVASNARGNATSDMFKIDVMEIVKPDAPENVTLQVEDREGSPQHLHVGWQRPANTGARSGWVTIKYEVRVRQDSGEWKEHRAGTQTHFSLFGVRPGAVYSVQVRCRLDHGSWSEWSNAAREKIPAYLQNERLFWILLSTLSSIPIMAAICILVMKRKNVKQCVMPPVPGPKIRGVDVQLLKSGQSEGVINALIISQNFPLTVARKDQMEDYLIVTDSGLLPDPSYSQKRKTSSVLPSGFLLASEIQCKDSNPSQNDWNGKNEKHNFAISSKLPSEDGPSKAEPPQAPAEGAAPVRANGGYVDVDRRARRARRADYSSAAGPAKPTAPADVRRRDGAAPEDYSRVEEVAGDSTVLLHKQKAPAGNGNHQAEKPRNPRAAGSGKAGEVDHGGYVDAVPAPAAL